MKSTKALSDPAPGHGAARDEVLDEYGEWMSSYRNSSMVTVKKQRRYLTIFLDRLGVKPSGKKLTNLSHQQVEDFYLDYCSSRGCASREQMCSALRVFLRFCFAKGYTERGPIDRRSDDPNL